ncbi:gas vesicle synthesis protein GvpL/GvpF [Thermacetogenium phaeum DSM 12270]|uniref:Gas vesicle synthesis protein GvpL/GvpF n=1 Tax=Thermacetogenium phaeum (strain ATCC BAA-254 / DSM 26808 / PB) TaxID=1089553 RepID=K4LTD3_THEPS|nr:GvpL/GvpF family gas vesicle protein [Thermacetogenium phaeum]AFV11284.1 gas vesicle synthesis protein GvpL/GvpF [Thermacetogenium phaeum DSM 12270]
MSEDLAVAGGNNQGVATVPGGRYVYCVAPVVDLEGKGLQGIDGNRVYQIAFRDIGALVHDCPDVPYQGGDEQVRAWLLAHHRVIEAVWDAAGTVLPMTFDMIIKGDAGCTAGDRVVRWLEDNYEAFKNRLEFFRRKAELRIRVIWERGPLLRIAACEDPEVKRLQVEMEGKPQGMAFFYKRKIEKRIREVVDGLADGIYRDCLNRLRPLVAACREEKPRRLEGKEMLLNLSVLAEEARIEDIGNLLGEIQEREGFEVIFTGPWPPYSFAAEEVGAEIN